MKHDLLQSHETFWIICALQLFIHFLPLPSQDNRNSIVSVSINDYTKYEKCSEVPFGMNHFLYPENYIF
jgi:hypothetical protein